MKVDYIITGQGICGTLLSQMLMSAGKTVMVFDQFSEFSAGRVASGLINPVTGMRVVKSWLMDELLPAANEIYSGLEDTFGIKIMNPVSILEFHPTAEANDIFNSRLPQYPEHIRIAEHKERWQQLFHCSHGVGEITSSIIIDLRLLQDTWRLRLKEAGALREELLDWSKCIVEENRVTYKDIEARKIICCEGIAGSEHPYFKMLPFALNKGEILIVDIPGLPRNHVYKNGLKIAPWEDGKFWVGASFDWKYTDTVISEAFRKQTERQLKQWLKLPFTIEAHWVALRPASVDHKPFAGFHPLHPAVGIFNGMGAKGCSQAPYFARNLAGHLLNGTPLHKEADVMRYKGMLSRG
ncbi:MAG: FAD-binding oxidoreductase [Taibaiella sp.]|nr:FAD-binding oxidoreductase [Taibaiella sp.]